MSENNKARAEELAREADAAAAAGNRAAAVELRDRAHLHATLALVDAVEAVVAQGLGR